MVEMPGVNGLGKIHGVAGAVDVHGHLAFGLIGAQVVHGGQMVEMIDLSLQPLDVICCHTQFFTGEVAKQQASHARC
jgi:hypothetical protein